ncbi:hypothetical protein GF367_03245 [Candidatus Woesearchaeota archaeon]|nr:hypothetical protein [Candidatus Woesearchaeota archaeon]
MARAILKVCPDRYWQQRRKECGAYVMKAILNMYGKDGEAPARTYLSFLGDLCYGFTWPRRVVKVLRRHGFFTEFRRANKLRHGKLDALRMHLLRQEPVILLIGNSFNPRRHYQHFKRWYGWHWMLLLGFDDAERKVYLYDPNVRLEKHERDIPIGNASLSYKRFMQQWRGVFFTSLFNYSYMPVIKRR